MNSKNYIFYLTLHLFLICFGWDANASRSISDEEKVFVCNPVSQISVATVSTNAATFTWVSGTVDTSWDVAVGLSSVTDPITIVNFENATSTTKEINGLTPGMEYKVWVRSVCVNDETSEWYGPVIFKTDCMPISNFNENLDAVPLETFPACWGKILRGESLSIGAKIKTVPFNAISAPNAIEITNWVSTGTYDIILVSPNLANLAAGTHRFRFTSKGDATLQIGTVSTNTNNGVFTLYEEVVSSTANTEHVIDFDLYEDSDTHIAIRLGTSAINNYIYLDNLIWEPIPACPDITNISVVVTTPTTATFIWNPNGSETAWNVAIGDASITDPSNLPFQTVTPQSVSEQNYYTVTNLVGQTNYKVWVRSVCGTTGVGSWIGPILFRTDCPTTANFNENFDTTQNTFLPECWSKILRGNGLSPNAKVEVAEIPIVAAKSVSLSNFTSTGDYDIILVSPVLSNLNSGTHHLRFFAKFASTFDVVTLSSNTNAAVYTIFETITTINGLAEYIVNFSGYTGTDKYVGIRLRSNSQPYMGISLDNIVWEAIPLCPEVSDVNVPTVSMTTAVIDWTPTPIESSWQIAFGGLEITDPNLLSPVPAPQMPFELTQLSAATIYKVWVRAVCGPNFGTWIGPVIFTTECPPVTTFIQNFDEETTPNLPLCWSKILRGGGLSQFAYINTSSSNVELFPNFTASNYIQMNAQGSQPTAEIILVSTKVSSLWSGTHRLKFDSFYPGELQIGTLNGNTKTAVFTPLATVQSGGFVGGSHVINFDTYTGTDTYIGIRLVPDTNILPSVNIDNLVWEPIPACPDVTQISVINSSQTGATISWIGGGTEQSWQVAVAESTVSDPNSVIAQPASATTLTIDELAPSTNYKVWVRSICSGENGAWIGPVAFLTPCTATNVPYFENFQSAIIPALPICTTSQITSSGSNNWVSHNGAVNFGFSTKALRYYDSMETANAWFFTRAINLIQGENYTISYKKGTNSNLSWMGANLKVMYGTAPYATSMTTTIADHVDFLGFGITENYTFTVPQTGVYYFSFNVYSNAYASSVFLDDISVTTTLSNAEFDANEFSYFPNPVTDFLNINSKEFITSIVMYNLLGQKILVKQVNGNETKVNMADMAKGTYIARITTQKGNKTIKVVKN